MSNSAAPQKSAGNGEYSILDSIIASQHSYDCKPLPTKYISSAEVLTFRDQAWSIYHNSPTYLNLIKSKFGQKTYDYIVNLKKINLSRKYSIDKVLAKASYE